MVESILIALAVCAILSALTMSSRTTSPESVRSGWRQAAGQRGLRHSDAKLQGRRNSLKIAGKLELSKRLEAPQSVWEETEEVESGRYTTTFKTEALWSDQFGLELKQRSGKYQWDGRNGDAELGDDFELCADFGREYEQLRMGAPAADQLRELASMATDIEIQNGYVKARFYDGTPPGRLQQLVEAIGEQIDRLFELTDALNEQWLEIELTGLPRDLGVTVRLWPDVADESLERRIGVDVVVELGDDWEPSCQIESRRGVSSTMESGQIGAFDEEFDTAGGADDVANSPLELDDETEILLLELLEDFDEVRIDEQLLRVRRVRNGQIARSDEFWEWVDDAVDIAGGAGLELGAGAGGTGE